MCVELMVLSPERDCGLLLCCVSCRQLGSCTADLSGLLRQGRDLADLLLELPLLKDCSQGSAATPAGAAAGQHVGPQQGQMQIGTLVVRLINIGREPSNAAAGHAVSLAAVPAAPGTPGTKVSIMRSKHKAPTGQGRHRLPRTAGGRRPKPL